MRFRNILKIKISTIAALMFIGVIAYALFPTNAVATSRICMPGAGIVAQDSIKDSTTLLNDSIAVARKADSLTNGMDSLKSNKNSIAEVADSLRFKDGRLDSLTLAKLVELKIQGEDSLIVQMYDSLQILSGNNLLPLDSLHLQKLAFPPKVYTKRELKRMAQEKRQQYRDSVIKSIPRFLNSYMFTDSSERYQRTIVWRADNNFNNPKSFKTDTSFNYYYSEMPAERNDVNAVSLGVSGSAMMYHNYFKREENNLFPFIAPYQPYSYTPQTMPFYNTKSPLTELAYWGTLFANKQKEESNVKFNHTQNFTPAFNFNVIYQRFGGKGILNNESTDNRTFALTANHLGKRYVAQGGYLYQKIGRTENGGVSDLSMVLDTIIDPKTIPVALSNAQTTIKKNTLFITHSYGVPFNIFGSKAERDSLGRKDSLGRRMIDTLGLDKGTVTFFGHSGEFTTYTKSYTDAIALTDSIGRALYNNNFYLNPTSTADSSRVMNLENRLFISVQPWKRDAVVSRLDIGAAYQYLRVYNFKPEYFLTGNSGTSYNNMYIYFGAWGKLKDYFSWEGLGKYNFAGYFANDFMIDGKIRFAAYPKKIKEGMSLEGRIYLAQTRPNFFYNNYCSNHYIWENNFDKTTETRVEAKFTVPQWNLEAFFGYSLLNNNIYFNENAIVSQNSSSMSILTAYLMKNFKLWKLHLNNKVLFQTSSNEEVVPLPKLSLNLRYYLEFDAVKDVMAIQIGANATLNTKYYAPGYSPALGLFYNQRETKSGGTPYIDAFVNFQWKRACIFVKYINAAQNWPNNDRFSANRYLRPASALKIGIYWPFYM